MAKIRKVTSQSIMQCYFTIDTQVKVNLRNFVPQHKVHQRPIKNGIYTRYSGDSHHASIQKPGQKLVLRVASKSSVLMSFWSILHLSTPVQAVLVTNLGGVCIKTLGHYVRQQCFKL